MIVYKNFEIQNMPTAVALGYFDGVHIGHQKVIRQTVRLKKKGVIPTVFTFSNNPKAIANRFQEKRITSVERKISIMENLGIEIMYIVDFLKVKNMFPEQFVRDILFKTLNAKYVVCGFNCHFGNNGNADASDLKKICAQYGILVKVVKPVLFNDSPVSSTRIRESLMVENLSDAEFMMKENYYRRDR